MRTKLVSRDYASELVTPLLNAVGGPLSSYVSNHYETGEHKEILAVPMPDPSGFGKDWRGFFAAYQAYSLLRKSKSLITGVNTRDVALARFLEDERLCSETNSFLQHPGEKINKLLNLVRKDVKAILGTFSWDRAARYLSHGPGACVGLRRERGHAWYKNGCINPSATQGAMALADAYIRSDSLLDKLWSENGVSPKGVAGSHITTVAKDAKTDRVIAIEPLLNMFFQRGIGGLMRSRLRRSGCDLNDQTVNQERALIGSINDSLATIDLSSASDSISRELVGRLLPRPWLEALALTRCSHSMVPPFGENKVGNYKFLQKWSSMGNGYTFELESLIFFSFARVISRLRSADYPPTVYGDDIVVDSKVASHLCEALLAVGFRTNVDKSFIWGPFRESCGKHYFKGIDVTPFYLREKIQGDEQVLRYCNGVRRLAHRFNAGYGCADTFQVPWNLGRKFLSHQGSTTYVPEGYGDVGLLRDFDEVSPKPKSCKGQVEGYYAKGLVRVYSQRELSEWPALITSLRSLEKGPMPVQITGTATKRNVRKASCISETTKRYKVRSVKIEVTQWTNTGPWLNLLSGGGV